MYTMGVFGRGSTSFSEGMFVIIGEIRPKPTRANNIRDVTRVWLSPVFNYYLEMRAIVSSLISVFFARLWHSDRTCHE
jgi:hypothetical protein